MIIVVYSQALDLKLLMQQHCCIDVEERFVSTIIQMTRFIKIITIKHETMLPHICYYNNNNRHFAKKNLLLLLCDLTIHNQSQTADMYISQGVG